MSWLSDGTELIGSGAWLSSEYPGHGVRGDAIPSTGANGPPPLYNDVTLPGEAADEFRWVPSSIPAGLTTFVSREDSAFIAAGPDNSYSFPYEGFKNGVSYGTTTVSFTIGSASAALAANGGSGTLSATASSPAVAALAATGPSGALSAVANSPAVATLAATGPSGVVSASASSQPLSTLAAAGASGSLAASAGIGSFVGLAATGASGALEASAYVAASAALSALGGEGAFAGSAYPLTTAQFAAVSGSGTLSASASTTAVASADLAGASGTLAASAWQYVSAALNGVGASGALSAVASSSSSGAGAADVWGYVLSNGLTAEQTAVETHAMLALVLKLLRNKQITNPSTGRMTVFDDDGSTVLLEGNLFEDSAGTVPYRGQGAERRERLA